MVSMLEIEDAVLFRQRPVGGFPTGFKGSSTEQQIIAENKIKQDAALLKKNVSFVSMPKPTPMLPLY